MQVTVIHQRQHDGEELAEGHNGGEHHDTEFFDGVEYKELPLHSQSCVHSQERMGGERERELCALARLLER